MADPLGELSEIIDNTINQTRDAVIESAVRMIKIQLGHPLVLESKIACDALKRAIENIEDLKR